MRMSNEVDLEDQWPPAPTNAARVMTLGPVQLEIDEDRIVGSAPAYAKLRRLDNFGAVLTVLMCGCFAPTLIVPGASSGIRFLILIVLLLAVAEFAVRPLSAQQTPRETFVVRRGPDTIQVGRNAEITLPAQSWIALDRVRGFPRNILRLNVMVPKEGKRKARRIGLAAFGKIDDAEAAKSEIENFLKMAAKHE